MPVQEIVTVSHLRKDGLIDRSEYLSVIRAISDGRRVLLPIDGLYGVAHLPKIIRNHQNPEDNVCEYLIDEISDIERIALLSKKEYDFLKRVWPDEVTVMLSPRNINEGAIFARMAASPLSQSIISEVGGALEFTPILNTKGKALYKVKELEDSNREDIDMVFIVKDWCKSHQLPTVIDIRDGSLHLVRHGRVSIDEISSLFFL